MFRDNKREIFSFRKYKNGRTDSKLIGATLLALGVGLVTTTQSVLADVVNGTGGSEVALVDSVDKTTSANTNTFTDDTDTSKVAKFDAVLNKGVAEPTKANENKGDADGSDVLTVTSETTVNYKLEEDNSLLKTETVATGQGTITTPYDKKGLAADTDGKDYRESTADKSGITVSEETGKQDTLELNGKVYERTRSEVEGADKAKYSKTQFNDIEASVSPEGMHNKLGEIDYTKTTGKVYLVEETSDGHYGKFVETDGVSSDEDAVSKWKAGLANAKDFTKANVTLQEGDSILVLDKDTYAVGNSTTVKTVKKFKSPTFELTPDTRNDEDGDTFASPTFTIQGSQDHNVSVTKLGPDGRFKTGDDVTETTVATSTVFGFDTEDFIYEDNPYFQLSPRKEDSSLQNPTAAEALKNNKSYRYLFDLLEFAKKQANTPEEAQKVAEVKARVDAYFEELPAKLKAIGADVVWVNSGVLANSYAFYIPTDRPIDVPGLQELLSPNGNLGKIIETLTFKNIEKQEFRGTSTLSTTTIEKSYTVDVEGSISLTKTTINHIEGQVTREQILENLEDTGTTKEVATELLKKGTVKVNDDGSITITSVETTPEYKFFQGESDNNVEAIPEGGYYKAQPDSGIEFISATETSSHNETTYNKRELITPIRAYKVVADGNSTVTHYYREKKAPLNVNYYLENTTTSLAPSENQVDLPVKSDYRTQSKEIPSKTEVQDLPEKTVTTVTTYELVATPDNANGKIAEGGTTVNYYYRAVEKVIEVAKQAPVTVNYYKEGTTEKLADTIEQGQKDIGSNYTTEAKSIPDKVEVQDLEDKVITKTTSYELVSEPTDKEGKVPVGGKVVNYYYREVVKEDVVKKQAPVTVNYYKEGTTEKLADTIEQGQKDIGSNYTTEAKAIPDKVEVQDLEDRVITKTTSYELVSEPTDKEGKVPVGGKVVNYFYREVVKEDVVMKQAPVTVNYYKEGTTEKLADTIEQGQKDIGSNYTTEAKSIPDKVEVQDLEDKVITKTTSYELVSEPTDKEGKVPVGGKVVNYYYREVVKEDVVKKQAPVTVNYYKEGTTDKLADSIDQGQKDIGSNYTSEPATIKPKVETKEFDDKTVTTTTTYELVKVPDDKDGVVPVGGKVVNYYYREVVKEDVVKKQAPVTVNYYKEGTTDKLADSVNQGQKDIGSNYTSEPATIKPKVETKEFDDKTVTTTTTYELVKVPDDKDGVVPVGGKVVNYYYREVVKEDVVKKQAPVTVNYYKEGTTDKLADSIDQGQKDIGSNYTSEPATIKPKVETKEFDDKTVTTTTTYELVKIPDDKDGVVPVGGKVVNYYYREVVKEDVVKKQAPVTVNYYKEGTTDKLADSIDQGQKDIGSNYTSEPATIKPKVETKELDDKTVTTTTSYELVKVPDDKDGVVPVGGKVVNYYYREVVKEDVVKKQAPVTVNYYKEGTTEKLADSIDQGQKDIGSNYTSEPATIKPKVETKEFDDKTVTTTTSYELVKVPDDKDGVVPVGGKVVNYYYREVVKEDVVKKQAPVTVNYYKEGTTDKLADSIDQGQKDIGSNYTSEAKVIPSKVEKVVENGNVITRTTSYELVKVPEDKDGIVPVGGKVVNYYYREVVEEVAKPNEAPKVEIPELKIPEESKPEPKPEPTPERTPTLQPAPAPQPAPQPEPSPALNPVPVTPETPERPIAPVTPEQPAEPATPRYMDGQRELPNTGTEANSSLAALGLLGVLSGFGLIARKKRKDEE